MINITQVTGTRRSSGVPLSREDIRRIWDDPFNESWVNDVQIDIRYTQHQTEFGQSFNPGRSGDIHPSMDQLGAVRDYLRNPANVAGTHTPTTPQQENQQLNKSGAHPADACRARLKELNSGLAALTVPVMNDPDLANLHGDLEGTQKCEGMTGWRTLSEQFVQAMNENLVAAQQNCREQVRVKVPQLPYCTVEGGDITVLYGTEVKPNEKLGDTRRHVIPVLNCNVHGN